VRVVHLTSRHPADDVRIFLKECRSLANAGFEVHLVAPGAVTEVRDGVAIHGFEPADGVRPLRIARRLWRSWRVARSVRADLYHFHEPELVPVGILLKLGGSRLVYDVHEDALSELESAPHRGGGRRIGLRSFEALARRSCDAFVAATPAIAGAFPPGRTIELLNYPLQEEFADASEGARGSTNIVYVGLITRIRGLREMVEAMHHVRDPQARLVLIGEFETAGLEQEARALPGWERVEFLGKLGRGEVRERLAASRAGLLVFQPVPNHTRALPNKLFEYMAAGLPVIASDFPYWHELLDPVGCATFADPLDPGRIAAAIDTLLADEEHARAMGRRGAAAVRERLNWQLEEPKLLELYRRLGQPAVV
jgi:glycosyltransferase involved in cell wall biosynthesis